MGKITGDREENQGIVINDLNEASDVEKNFSMTLGDINKKTFKIVVEQSNAKLVEVKSQAPASD